MNSELKYLLSPESYTGNILHNQGPQALLRYLKQPANYVVATVPANWGILGSDSILLGKLGHHALIVLPGNRVCEWNPIPTTINTNTQFSQNKNRTATGKTIEQIWSKHQDLSPKYHKNGSIFDGTKEGYCHYMPFLNDCFSYIDRVITEVNQPPSQLNRV